MIARAKRAARACGPSVRPPISTAGRGRLLSLGHLAPAVACRARDGRAAPCPRVGGTKAGGRDGTAVRTALEPRRSSPRRSAAAARARRGANQPGIAAARRARAALPHTGGARERVWSTQRRRRWGQSGSRGVRGGSGAGTGHEGASAELSSRARLSSTAARSRRACAPRAQAPWTELQRKCPSENLPAGNRARAAVRGAESDGQSSSELCGPPARHESGRLLTLACAA